MTRNTMNEKLLLALTLERDEKLDLRLCADLKRELKAESRRFGFKSVSDYVIAILSSRRVPEKKGGEE